MDIPHIPEVSNTVVEKVASQQDTRMEVAHRRLLCCLICVAMLFVCTNLNLEANLHDRNAGTNQFNVASAAKAVEIKAYWKGDPGSRDDLTKLAEAS